jgi:hypothetical protein
MSNTLFSKTEKELLEHLITNDHRWFYKKYSKHKMYSHNDLYDENLVKQENRKYNYYRQLKSRINRKVKTMKEDLELYYKVLKKESRF